MINEIIILQSKDESAQRMVWDSVYGKMNEELSGNILKDKADPNALAIST